MLLKAFMKPLQERRRESERESEIEIEIESRAYASIELKV
jgi:hypothetical protein